MFKLGSSGDEVARWQGFMVRKYKSYAAELPIDGYFGYHDRDIVAECQRRLRVPVTGVADDAFLAQIGFTTAGPPVVRSSTWVYTAAGTSAAWNVGPQFAIGHASRDRGKNHQPVAYPAAGFLGLTGSGTDPRTSYLESITALKHEWARLLRINTTGDIVVCGYSQSADGFIRAALELFGDGGEFVLERPRLKLIIALGNPCRQQGPTAMSGSPPGWGISRLVLPGWLAGIVADITTHNDLYACATDDTLVPLFYDVFTRAEAGLPFVIYCAQIIIPAIASGLGIVAPLLGTLGAGNPLGMGSAAALAAVTGVGLPILLKLIEGFSGAPPPDPKLVEVFTAKGLLTNLPKLIKTLVVLVGGVQVHGLYHVPRPEFGNRTGVDIGIELVNRIA